MFPDGPLCLPVHNEFSSVPEGGFPSRHPTTVTAKSRELQIRETLQGLFEGADVSREV
jgi:hypothetical protein